MYRARCYDTVSTILHPEQERSHGKAMIEDTPNVVTEDGLRSLLGRGYFIEVVCKEAGERRHNTWYGVWIARAVSADGHDEKLLVTSRSVLKVREFKTIVGLVSFLAEMGCDAARIPLKEGGRERHSPPRKGPVLVKDS